MVLFPEVSAVVGGQVTQKLRGCTTGSFPDAWLDLFDLPEAFDYSLDFGQASVNTIGDLVQRTAEFGGETLHSRLSVQGCGYGDDGPLVVDGRASPRVADIPMEPNTVLVLKTSLRREGVSIWQESAPVLVTERGIEPLAPMPGDVD